MTARRGGGVDRFIGRADELRRVLATCTAVASEGRGHLVVVSGEPGIGKSRFCDELARRVAAEGIRVAQARCWSGGGAPPLWPWQPILHDLCGAEAAALLDGDAGSGTIDRDRFARFVAVGDRLADTCRQGPACIVLDDLHAADASALLLTRFVVRSLHRLPLVLVVSRRRGAVADPLAAQLLEEIAREAMLIDLRHFDLQETNAFLAAGGLDQIDHHLVLAILRVTGGNPLFLRRLVSIGTPDPEALPAGVRAAIDAAIAGLSPTARTILTTAALLRPPVAISEAAAVFELEGGAVMNAIDEGTRAGLVSVEGTADLVFTHDLVRTALEEALPPAARLDAHARAAAMLAAPTGAATADRLARGAHHALAAAARSAADARLAVEACRGAAAAMVRSFAYEQAASLLADAVRVHDAAGTTGSTAGLLVEWGEAVLRCGRLAEARPVFDRAATAAEHEADPVVFARAALGLGGVWVHEHRAPLALERVLGLQRRALAGLPAEAAALRCRLESRLAAEAVYQGAASVDGSRAALAAARRCGDLGALAESLSLCHHALLTAEHTHERLPLAEELIAVASVAGEGTLALMGLCWRAVDLFHLSDPSADRALADLRERADALACQSLLYVADVLDVMRMIRAGRLDEAEAAAGRCYETGTAVGDIDAFGYFGAQIVAIRWFQGRDGELLEVAEEVATSATLVPAEFAFRAVVANLAARTGQLDRARAALDLLAPSGLEALPQSSTWLAGMLTVVETATALGDAALADRAYGLLLPYADLPVMPSLAVVCLGSTERPLGLAALTAGRVEVAVDHLGRALAANRRLGNRPLVAITRADLAQALVRRAGPGDHRRAVELLTLAAADAEDMGMETRARQWVDRRDALDAQPAGERTGEIRREGRQWVITLGDRRALVGDLVGMDYLAELLTHPGEAITALSLASHGALVADGAPQALADDTARASYARRARELAANLAAAEAGADAARAERVRVEMDALTEEIERTSGFGGRARHFSALDERARTAVRKAIKRVLDEIEDSDPVLGLELRTAIATGRTCSYRPDPRRAVSWRATRAPQPA